jgi:hypothetical protein
MTAFFGWLIHVVVVTGIVLWAIFTLLVIGAFVEYLVCVLINKYRR